MKGNEKPVLSHKWWTTNKAKTLKPTAFDKALKAYDDALGKKNLAGALKALEDCRKGVQEAIKQCGTLQNETKQVLQRYPDEIDREKKALTLRLQGVHDLLKKIEGLTLKGVLEAKGWLTKFEEHAADTHSDENLMFVRIMQKTNMKGSDKIYEMFIKLGSQHELNLDKSVIDAITEAKEQGEWGGPAWKTAYENVRDMLEDDTLSKFKKKLAAELKEEYGLK